jgi:hypothetical protein
MPFYFAAVVMSILALIDGSIVGLGVGLFFAVLGMIEERFTR